MQLFFFRRKEVRHVYKYWLSFKSFISEPRKKWNTTRRTKNKVRCRYEYMYSFLSRRLLFRRWEGKRCPRDEMKRSPTQSAQHISHSFQSGYCSISERRNAMVYSMYIFSSKSFILTIRKKKEYCESREKNEQGVDNNILVYSFKQRKEK